MRHFTKRPLPITDLGHPFLSCRRLAVLQQRQSLLSPRTSPTGRQNPSGHTPSQLQPVLVLLNRRNVARLSLPLQFTWTRTGLSQVDHGSLHRQKITIWLQELRLPKILGILPEKHCESVYCCTQTVHSPSHVDSLASLQKYRPQCWKMGIHDLLCVYHYDLDAHNMSVAFQ